MGKRYQPIQPPSYYLNKNFEPSQEYLNTLGQNIVSGNIPDYYSGIGESNSQEFQNYLNNALAKTGATVAEQLSATGNARQGVGADIMARSANDISANYGYQDYLRAMQGKQNLLGLGTGLVSGVADRSLSESGNKNQFNLGVYNTQESSNQYAYNAKMTQKAQEDALLSSILSAGIGVAGNVIGMGMMGGMGAPSMQSALTPYMATQGYSPVALR